MPKRDTSPPPSLFPSLTPLSPNPTKKNPPGGRLSRLGHRQTDRPVRLSSNNQERGCRDGDGDHVQNFVTKSGKIEDVEKVLKEWSLLYTDYNKQDGQTDTQPASSRPSFQGTFGTDGWMNDMNGVAMSESFRMRGDGDQKRSRDATETTKGKKEKTILQQSARAFLSFLFFSLA